MGHTHDWTAAVDTDHLDEIRRNAKALATGGVLHLALEVLAYPVDEALEGSTEHIRFVLHGDGSVSVADDGRGTETRVGDDGVATVKPIMATRDLRFYGRDDAPVLPAGGTRGTVVHFRPDPGLVPGSVSADEISAVAATYAAIVAIEVVDDRG